MMDFKQLSLQIRKELVQVKQKQQISNQKSIKFLNRLILSNNNQADVNIISFIATEDDTYRKPSVGMWNFFTQMLKNSEINLKESFYCGDAGIANLFIKKAGRVNGKKKDFSDSDQ